MAWGVFDYPEPSLEWELAHYEQDGDEYTDEWEEFYGDDEDEFDEYEEYKDPDPC